MSLEEVAHAISPDLSLTTIAKLEGSRMGLTLDWMQKVARAMKCSPHDLIAQDELPFSTLPVVGKIAAGNWAEAIEHPDGYMPVPGARLSGREFLLQVRGDSMDKLVQDGGWVVVDPDAADLVPGKLYAVRNGDGDATFKRFELDPPRLEPCSNSTEHQAIRVGATPFTVIGRVVRGWSDF